MSKYSEEFKISVVKKYLDDKIPILELARELEIDRSLILLWIKKYNANGFINKKGKARVFSSEFYNEPIKPHNKRRRIKV